MNHYFVLAYFQNVLAPYSYVGTNEEEANRIFSKASEEMPHEMYRFNESTKMVESYEPIVSENRILDWKWVPIYRAWFVVRNNPGFNYPETVICKDGIFDTLTEAEAFIRENGGSWKLYSFSELQEKMIESADLMARLKTEQEKLDETPF